MDSSSSSFQPIKFSCDCTLARSELQWKDDLKTNFEEIIIKDDNRIKLLGCEIEMRRCSVQTVQHLFSMIKKYINLLRNQIFSKRDAGNSSQQFDWSFIRSELIKLIWLFNQLIIDRTQSNQINEITILWTELKQLLLFAGRICTLPESIFYELNTLSNNDTPAYHLFHLHVELWYNCLQLVHLQSDQGQLLESVQLIKDGLVLGDVATQMSNLLLADQLMLACIKFRDEFKGQTIKFLNPFPCECNKILLIRICRVLQHSKSIQGETDCGMHAVWTGSNRILDQILENGFKLNDSSHSTRQFRLISTPVEMGAEEQGLCRLWIVSSMAELFDFDENFVKTQARPTQSIGFSQPIVQETPCRPHNLIYTVKLLQKLVKQEDCKDEPNHQRMMIIMRLSYKFVELWEPSVDLLLPFLDFFVKRINSHFGSNSVESMQMIPKTGLVWAQKIRQKSLLLPLQNDGLEENLLQMFLSLLYSFVKQIHKCRAQIQFQKLKGRLYMKLQPKKLDELKELGFYNLLTLFLTLVHASDTAWTDLIDKFGDLIKHGKARSLTHPKVNLLLKSCFAFYNLIDQEVEAPKLTNILTSFFNEIADQLPAWTPDNLHSTTLHNTYSTLIFIYCEELLLFFDSNHSSSVLPVSIPDLFEVKFDAIVNKLSERESGQMARFAYNVLKYVRTGVDGGELESNLVAFTRIYKCFYSSFLNFIKNEFQNVRQTNLQTADIAFQLTYLSLMLSHDETDFKNCVRSFAFNRNGQTACVCKYLCLSLACENTCQKLSEIYPTGLDQLLLESWCRILISTQHPNVQFNRLTSELSKHVQLLHGVEDDDDDNDDDDDHHHGGGREEDDALCSFKNFCIKLRIHVDSLSMADKAEAIVKQNRFLLEMINEAKLRVRDETLAEDLLHQIYAVCSILVQHCCPLLYLQGNSQTVLPVLLESLFNPNFILALSPTKQAQVQAAIRKCLPKFFYGIEDLLAKNDPYLERKLKQLLAAFVPMFTNKNLRHPITLAITNGSNVNKGLLRLLNGYLYDTFLVRTTNPSTSFQMLQFLTEMHQVNRSSVQIVEWMFELWPSLLTKLLVCEEIVKKRIKELLQTLIVEQMQTMAEEELSAKMLKYYENFIKCNKHVLGRVIKVVEQTLPLYGKIKDSVIGIILAAIQEVEQTKFGSDDALRSTFQIFVSNLTKC